MTKHINATLIAQKALSAIYRLREEVSEQVVIDVLRGTNSREVVENHYDSIKTFGVGKALTEQEWQHYLKIMVIDGLIALNDYTLTILPYGYEVLFKGEKYLIKTLKKEFCYQDELLSAFTNLLITLGLSDAKLVKQVATDIITKMPQSLEALKEIGEIEPLISNDKSFYLLKLINDITHLYEPVSLTHIETGALYVEGNNLLEIAEKQSLSPLFVFAQLAYLYEQGEPIKISEYLTQQEYDEIKSAFTSHDPVFNLKPVFNFFNGRFGYDKIRMAAVKYRRMKKAREVLQGFITEG